jgi:hypothetical protein
VAGRQPQDQAAGVAGQPAGDGDQPVGAENLCHQAIFVNHAPSAVAPPDAEVV